MSKFTISPERKQKAFDYLDLIPTQRPAGISEFRKSMHFSPTTWKDIKKEWRAIKRRQGVDPDDIDAYLRENEFECIKSIVRDAKAGKPKAQELWAKMTGKLINKSEKKVIFEFNAEDHHRIRQQAIEDLRQGGIPARAVGDREVLPESDILLAEICEGNG